MTTTDKPKRPRPRTNHGGGWNPKGELHPMAVLTADKVRDIRRELLNGASRVGLANAFGITPRTVRAIAERTRWGHVE